MTIAEKIARAKADYDAVFEAGKKAEYDAFWESIQNGGSLKSYNYVFGSRGWNDITFKPKYNMKPSWACVAMFQYSGFTDLEALLNECGVTLDLSDNANYISLFYASTATVLPEITFSGFATSVSSAFAECASLHTIRKITLKDGFNSDMSSCFKNCTALENVVFEGVIPKSISFAQSVKLSKASIINIIEHLSPTATGQTATFSKTAVDNAFWGELLTYPYYIGNFVTNGITFTDNGDRSISVNGTASHTAVYTIEHYTFFYGLAGKKVKVTGCPSGGSIGTYSLFISEYKDGQYQYEYLDTGKGCTFTVKEGYDYTLQVRIAEGYTADNLVFNPSIVSTTADGSTSPEWNALIATKPNWTISLS